MILITGATGFVGSHLVNKLTLQHEKTRCFVRGNTLETNDIRKDAEIFKGDLLDKNAVDRSAKDIQKVVHLAATLQDPDPEAIRRINVEGTRNLVDSCIKHGVEKFIFLSTLNVTLPGKNQYSKTKLEAEHIVQESGLDFTILRPSIIYGKGDNGTISQLIESVKAKKRITLLGNGEYKLQPVFIDDVVKAICEVLNNSHNHKHRTYFLVGKDIVSYNELVDLISDITGYKSQKRYVPISAVKIAVKILSIFLKRGILLKDKINTYSYDKNVDTALQKDIFPQKSISLADGISKCCL